MDLDFQGALITSSFEEAYDASKMDVRMSSAIAVTAKDLGHEVPDLSLKTSVTSLHMVQSVMGDDEFTTTNCELFGFALITAGQELSKIRLSRADTGVCRDFGNYTEGWVITPPSAEAGFTAVTRRHKGEGIPLVLDIPKLKLISPVRKQSVQEVDLESKYGTLTEQAAWVHRLWPTYHLHQAVKLLATGIMDFTDARSFPYLYRSEGGCGGAPPYDNLDTARTALFRYRRGGAKAAVIAAMDQAYKVHYGTMALKDAFVLRASDGARETTASLAAACNLERVVRDRYHTPVEAEGFLDFLRDQGQTIPAELLEKSMVLTSRDPVVGQAVSHLRTAGHIMTNVDVKVYLAESERTRAITGDVPMVRVLEKIEEEKKNARKGVQYGVTKLLTALCEISPEVEGVLAEAAGIYNDVPLCRDVLARYYKLRTEEFGSFSSLGYEERLRVFRTSDVKSAFTESISGIRDDIKPSFSAKEKPFEVPAERKIAKKVELWLDSDDLERLLSGPLPAGIGPDDGRLLRKAQKLAYDAEGDLCIFLMSSDRGLFSRMQHMTSARPGQQIRLVQIPSEHYLVLCSNPTRRASTATFYNVFGNRYQSYDLSLFSALRLGLPLPMAVATLYDYPNLTRYLEITSTAYTQFSTTPKIRGGGFLRKETLDAARDHSKKPVTSIPLQEMSQLDDFNIIEVNGPSGLKWTSGSLRVAKIDETGICNVSAASSGSWR